MLSREDNRRLAQMERQLRRDDPEFCSRMEGGQPEAPDRPRRISLSLILTAVVIWIAAIVLAVVGWWIATAVAALCATVVVTALIYRAHRPRPS